MVLEVVAFTSTCGDLEDMRERAFVFRYQGAGWRQAGGEYGLDPICDGLIERRNGAVSTDRVGSV